MESSMRKVQNPLRINVFWHNESDEMHSYANHIYNFYSRNKVDPADTHLNIPVSLYPKVPQLDDVQLEESECTMNVILIEDRMCTSGSWLSLIDELSNHPRTSIPHSLQIFPVAFSSSSLQFIEGLSRLNCLELFEEAEIGGEKEYLLINLTNELASSLLITQDQYKKKTSTHLFVSHVSDEGEQFAEHLRKYQPKFPALQFDIDVDKDPMGPSSQKDLEHRIKGSVVVVLHTEQLSACERCQTEILLAKENGCPMIVIDLRREADSRSFPYVGNVPHICYTDKITNTQSSDNMLSLVFLEIFKELLRIRYNQARIKMIAESMTLEVPMVLPYPPELLTLVYLNNITNETIIYPDPPLGRQELELIKKIRPDLQFITPTLMPLLSKDGKHIRNIQKCKVAIAFSNISSSEVAWIDNREMENLIADISLYLLISGSHINYSELLNYPTDGHFYSYSKVLLELLDTYCSVQNGSFPQLNNYNSYPNYEFNNKDHILALRNAISITKVPPPKYLNVEREDSYEIKKGDTFDKKYVIVKALTVMRKEMIASSNAVILLGGKSLPIDGSLPEILEEYLIAAASNKPVYILGGFGGISGQIARSLMYPNTDDALANFPFIENVNHLTFIKEFNTQEWTEKEEKVDFEEIGTLLNLAAQSNNFGLENGLNRAENIRLFQSKNGTEILSLLIKGLRQISVQ